jgi:hypothetical protein
MKITATEKQQGWAVYHAWLNWHLPLIRVNDCEIIGHKRFGYAVLDERKYDEDATRINDEVFIAITRTKKEAIQIAKEQA